MQTLPDFSIGLFNGWLPLVLYFVGFLLALVPFSGPARARLFEDPRYRMSASIKLVRMLGQAAMFAYIDMKALWRRLSGIHGQDPALFLVSMTSGAISRRLAQHEWEILLEARDRHDFDRCGRGKLADMVAGGHHGCVCDRVGVGVGDNPSHA